MIHNENQVIKDGEEIVFVPMTSSNQQTMKGELCLLPARIPSTHKRVNVARVGRPPRHRGGNFTSEAKAYYYLRKILPNLDRTRRITKLNMVDATLAHIAELNLQLHKGLKRNNGGDWNVDFSPLLKEGKRENEKVNVGESVPHSNSVSSNDSGYESLSPPVLASPVSSETTCVGRSSSSLKEDKWWSSNMIQYDEDTYEDDNGDVAEATISATVSYENGFSGGFPDPSDSTFIEDADDEQEKVILYDLTNNTYTVEEAAN